MHNTSRNVRAVKGIGIVLAYLTYAGGVAYGDIMFLVIMWRSNVLPDGFLGTIALAGAITTAVSALVLPIGLHWWFAPGPQLVSGFIFLGVDIIVLALNSMLAWQVGTGADAGIWWWQIISPATPLLAVVGWSVIFATDTSNKLTHADLEAEADTVDAYLAGLRTALNSDEVNTIIQQGAMANTRQLAGHVSGQRPPAQPQNTRSIAETIRSLFGGQPEPAPNGGHAAEAPAPPKLSTDPNA